MGRAKKHIIRHKVPGYQSIHSVTVFATARKLAQPVYRLVRYGQAYFDTGAKVYEARCNQRRLNYYTKTLQSMGYNVEAMEPEETPAT